MSILETKVSAFKGTKQTEVTHEITIGEVLNDIKDGKYKNVVNKVREGDSEYKKQLPTIAMHGLFEGYRKKANFYEASGLIILDFDDIPLDEIEETKEDIMESYEHVLASMISPSGNGIKVLYYINPDSITADNYKQVGAQIQSKFELYGHVDVLSVTDCLIMTYDPNILINEDVESEFILIEDYVKKVVELEKRDADKTLWECPEDFFETVLCDNIAENGDNNYHYIQMSLMELCKFGFTHPEHDLDFVIDYSENEFKYSPDNKTRFLEAVKVVENQYSQTMWAYKTISCEFEDDVMPDYSDFEAEDYLPMAVVGEDGVTEDDLDDDGFIIMRGFFERVLIKMAEGDRVGYEVALKELANIFRFKGTGIHTVTGIPTHGKSEAMDVVTIDLMRLYMQETIIVGYEQDSEEHMIKLMRKLLGVDIRVPEWMDNEKNMVRAKQAFDLISDKIHWVDTPKVGGNINKVLLHCAEKIQKLRKAGKDVKYVIIDPYNMLSITGKFSGHESVTEILRRITEFSHKMDVLVHLVAHPFKMSKDENGIYQVPDFYSVKGSSAFFEMSYHGTVIYRMSNGLTLWKVLKVKQNNLGEKDAEAFFLYDKPSGRYIPCDIDANVDGGDHYDTDWLERALVVQAEMIEEKEKIKEKELEKSIEISE